MNTRIGTYRRKLLQFKNAHLLQKYYNIFKKLMHKYYNIYDAIHFKFDNIGYYLHFNNIKSNNTKLELLNKKLLCCA